MDRRLKRWELALMLGLLIAMAAGSWLGQEQRELSDRIIRLHVIANSDSQEDQALKLAVRDRVLAQAETLYPPNASLEEARASDKAICLIPAGDGRVYELRKTELGEFVAPKDNVVEFSRIRAGFTPALPLIPASLLSQIIAFFAAT